MQFYLLLMVGNSMIQSIWNKDREENLDIEI